MDVNGNAPREKPPKGKGKGKGSAHSLDDEGPEPADKNQGAEESDVLKNLEEDSDGEIGDMFMLKTYDQETSDEMNDP